MIQEAIKKLIENQNLSFAEAKDAMNQIMEGNATEAQIGSFLTAMRMKGETIEEMTACATVLREKCQVLAVDEDVLDIVGTGGDKTNTFNISTTVSFVVAAYGIKVAKHGNRSVSSQCGSADVLEALGVKLELDSEANKKVLQKTGMCFMFAPMYHGSMKYAAKPRRELAIRSVFNLLGPLANPAYAKYQLLGVYEEKMVVPMAMVLKELGVKHALVVCGENGIDEVNLTGSTTVCEIKEGKLNSFLIEPEMLGLKRCKLQDLRGGDAGTNAGIIRSLFEGKLEGPMKDMVILNSGFAIYAAESDKTLKVCLQIAREMIESGKALAQLEAFIQATQEMGEPLCS
ncbi:MAG: anthranilate phosphoribosyltransferase [Cellulosilyticaceae bacterium]